ncbi:MAG: hypothetical protein ABIJ56_08255 [Pseudomonadota bacterium]
MTQPAIMSIIVCAVLAAACSSKSAPPGNSPAVEAGGDVTISTTLPASFDETGEKKPVEITLRNNMKKAGSLAKPLQRK